MESSLPLLLAGSRLPASLVFLAIHHVLLLDLKISSIISFYSTDFSPPDIAWKNIYL